MDHQRSVRGSELRVEPFAEGVSAPRKWQQNGNIRTETSPIELMRSLTEPAENQRF